MDAVPAECASLERPPFISIVMPCLNEEGTVAFCVRKARGWLERSGYDGEVLVVDNGSSDRSAQLAESAGARVVAEARRGYGVALRRGFTEARGEWLIMGDADDTYDFGELDAMLGPLLEGADISVGNRLDGEMAPDAMAWSHRYVGTPALTLLLKVFAGSELQDSQCGLRALTRDAVRRLDLRADGMELASEMLLKAARQGLQVVHVPVPYAERLGQTKLRTVRDGWRHLRFLLLASPTYLFTVPGAILALLGVVTLALALPTNGVAIGELRWQPLFAGGIFTVVGMNALLLGFASRLYTTARGITRDDRLLRFYHRYLGLETFLTAGVSCAVVGFAIDLMLVSVPDGHLNRLDLAAIAQTLIIVGANVALVGALASLLEDA
jgi:glycosyltransferase involved in cell wall biosynthesis